MARSFLIRLCLISLLLLLNLPLLLFSQSARKSWVYFTDKGHAIPSSGNLAKSNPNYQKALEYVHTRALARRAKVLSTESLLDAADLPLYQPYLDQVKNVGGVLYQQSRWLNAASFTLTEEEMKTISRLSFVKEIVPVVILRGRENRDKCSQASQVILKSTSMEYGPSAAQAQMINVPLLHDFGITGHGVLLGMLDTGFRWRVHESLQTRHVVAEYDFIQKDSITANQAGDSFDQDEHGTLTMSTVGGYKPGQLIGPAFDADFILGKTEFVPTETRIEEDNWAAAVEWMEGYGVDVISSSLGYNTFDPPDNGYTWAHRDFDGRTSITAKAAARAARLGVVVCDAMGNEGNGNGVVGTMLTPADADSIISVGAVDFSRHLWSRSSTGPTNDGRYKPDVVSPGVGVYCASTAAPGAYFYATGTSLATPLAAGAAALLLSARPELTPIQVRDALCITADTIDVAHYPTRPNNFIGWGLVNAFNAVLSFGPIFSNTPAISTVDSQSVVSINVVSKFGVNHRKVILHYAVGSEIIFFTVTMNLDSSMFFPTSGRYKVTIPTQMQGTLVRFYIDAQDSSNNSYRSPAEISHTLWQLQYGTSGVGSTPEAPSAFVLFQNYPNPFNSSTRIEYDLPRTEHVIIKVYDVLGQLVTTLVDEVQNAGVAKSRPPVFFNPDNLPSGVYFYRLTTSSFVATRKMMILR